MVGVADVQAAEQAHESMIKVLAERHVKLSFEIKAPLYDSEEDDDESEVPDVS